MSAANSAAKKRRAPSDVVPPLRGQSTSNAAAAAAQPAAAGLTLPQVIALVDKRLVSLETFVAESKQNHVSAIGSLSNNNNVQMVPGLSDEDRDEYETRFNILAQEIASIKNIVLQLQSYTMSVTKTFMEEKTGTVLPDIEVMTADLEPEPTFSMSNSA